MTAITTTGTETIEVRKGFARRHVGGGPKPADTRPVIGYKTSTGHAVDGVIASVATAKTPVGTYDSTITLTTGEQLPAISGVMRADLGASGEWPTGTDITGRRITGTWNSISDGRITDYHLHIEK